MTFTNGKVEKADFVIGADGIHSAFSEMSCTRP